MRWLKSGGLAEILQRALQIARFAARNAPAVQEIGILRLQADGIVEIPQRAL